MRYPEFLREGGTIGFIAPSFGSVMQPYASLFESAVKYFESIGYKTVEGPNCHADCGIGKSNTASECGSEINSFFCNDTSDVIISCGGGETMCEDLPFVDFEKIASSKPKWFMGYSDNTNLVLTLATLCDTASIYGPCASSFGQKQWHKSIEDAFDVLCGKKLSVSNYAKWEIEENPNAGVFDSYNCTEDFNIKIFRGSEQTDSAQVTGRLLGGCLDCLDTLCGTEFDRVKQFNKKYEKDGTLWFIESCDLGPMDVRRSLWHLKNAGWFESAKGFLIGRPLRYNDIAFGLDQTKAAIDMLCDFNVPVIMNLDIGHLPPQMPVICGSVANARASAKSFEMDYVLR